MGAKEERHVSNLDRFGRKADWLHRHKLTEADTFFGVSLKKPEQQVCQLAGRTLRDSEEEPGVNFSIDRSINQ